MSERPEGAENVGIKRKRGEKGDIIALATCQDGKSLVEQFKSLKMTPAGLEESSDEGSNVTRRRGKGN